MLKPANYATEINIHNPNYKQVPLRKKFLVLVNQGPQNPRIVREPAASGAAKIVTMTLGPDYATMDDCNNLWTLTYPAVPLAVADAGVHRLSGGSQPGRTGR